MRKTSKKKGEKPGKLSSEKQVMPMPTPAELAAIAAILQPDPLKAEFEPKFGIRKAMEFYLEAVDFLRNVTTDFEKLALRFGSDSLKAKLRAAEIAKLEPMFARERGRVLTLGPQSQAQNDKVLAYLRTQGLIIATTKGVKENLMRWHDRPANEVPLGLHIPDEFRRTSSTEFIAQFKQPNRRYTFPLFLLRRAAGYAAWVRSQSKRKGAATKRERAGRNGGQADNSEKN